MPPKRNRNKKKDKGQEGEVSDSSQAAGSDSQPEQQRQSSQQQQHGPQQGFLQQGPQQQGPQQQGPRQQGTQQQGPRQQGPQQQGPRQQRPQQQGPRQRGPQQQGPRPQMQQQQQAPRGWGLQQQQQQPPPQQQGPRPQMQPQQQGPRPQMQQQQQAPPGWGPQKQQQQQAPPAWGPQQQQQPPPQQQGPRPQMQQQQQAPPGWGPQKQQQQQAPPAWGPQQQQQPPPQQQGPRPQMQPQQQGPRPQMQPQQQGPRPQMQPQQQGPRPQMQQQQQAPPGWGPQQQQQQPRPQMQPQQQRPQQHVQQQQPKRAESMQIAKVEQGQGEPSSQKVDSPKQPSVSGEGDSKIITAKISLSAEMTQKYIDLIPKRKDPFKCGTKGRRITVETNMFKLVFGQHFAAKAIHYDVTIDPDKPKFMMRPTFEAVRKKCFPMRHPAFDGKKNAYTASDLPFGTRLHEKVEVYNEEKMLKEEFTITLKKVNEIDLSWIKSVKPGFTGHQQMMTGMQVLDIILHHGPSSYLTPVGRSLFYPPTSKPVELPNAMQLWYGTFMSAVAGWKPYVNIDVAHKAFPTPQPVIDTMKELCRLQRNDKLSFQDISRNMMTLSKYLKGLKVQHEIPGKPNTKRTHRIIGLVETSARTDKFSTSDGKVYTVEQYFREQHNYNIVFPDLPCLWVGSVNKKNHIPVELCKIAPGQVTQRKMDPDQTSGMIRHAATNTDTRRRKILDAFSAVRLNEQPTVKDEFGLSVDGKFEQVPARVLQAPKLVYNNRSIVEPRKGTWWVQKFERPAVLQDSCWTILNLDGRTRDDALYDLAEKLQGYGPRLAMQIGKVATPFVHVDVRNRDAKKRLADAFKEFKQNNYQLVVVILPFKSEDAYHIVKQCSELGVSVLTQCIKCETLRKLSDSTLGNILQKLNAKLNGVNHSFDPGVKPKCLTQPCILIGADVTHPSPDAKDIPSIAAVVASHDSKAFQYNVQVRLQPPRLEIIQDLENIIVEQLNFFKQKTSCFPRILIFYRDGVSEGQFPQVMHYEIGAMKRAFRRIGPDCNPAITFLVVQKRHHIRLFPTDKRNSDDKNFNVQAGTIVDTDITHPSHIDFYLVSHASIQGTARPTKYRCLLNEACLSEDDIEELTYYLCHMFARCARSVSYPAPTYYAHLAAFRGRAYIHAKNICMSKLEQEQKDKLGITRLIHDNPMFFV